MTRIVLWRHARTPYNREKRLQGSLDIPLDDDGVAQATDAAARILAVHGTPDAVVCSPLARAHQTANALASQAGLVAHPHNAFTQRTYGEWEGLTWAQVRARWPEEYARRARGADPAIEGWERSSDVAARVAAGIRAVTRADQTVVIVSHGSAITMGVAALIGVDPASRLLGHLPHAAWNLLERSPLGVWHVNAYALGAD